MSILYFLLAINFAVIPTGGIDLYNNIYILSPDEEYKIGFISEIILLDALFIGGSADIYMDPNRSSFKPKILDSQFYIKADFEWVEFKFLHRCTHPICAWVAPNSFKKYYESWYREISINGIYIYFSQAAS